MSAESAQSFSAKLIKLSAPPQATVEAAETRARALIADAEARAQAIQSEATRAAEALLADIRARADSGIEEERANALARHRAALARDVEGLKATLSGLIGEAVEKIVGDMPSDVALAGAVRRILGRLGDLTELKAVAEPHTLEGLQRSLSGEGIEITGLRFERDAQMRPGRVALVGANLRAEVDVLKQIEMFKAMARGEV